MGKRTQGTRQMDMSVGETGHREVTGVAACGETEDQDSLKYTLQKKKIS